MCDEQERIIEGTLMSTDPKTGKRYSVPLDMSIKPHYYSSNAAQIILYFNLDESKYITGTITEEPDVIELDPLELEEFLK